MEHQLLHCFCKQVAKTCAIKYARSPNKNLEKQHGEQICIPLQIVNVQNYEKVIETDVFSKSSASRVSWSTICNVQLELRISTYTPLYTSVCKGISSSSRKRTDRTPQRMPSARPDQSPSPFNCIWAAVEMWTVAPLMEHKRYRASPALFNLS